MLSKLFSKRQLPIKRIYIFILWGGVVLSALLIFIDKTFVIKNVEIHSLSSRASPKIGTLKGFSSLYKQSIFFVSDEQLHHMIESQNPYIKDIIMRKRFPDTIDITVELHTAFAYLQVNSGVFLLAQNGRILEKSKLIEDLSLPLLKYYQQLDYYAYQSGDTIDLQDIVAALDFTGGAQDYGYTVSTIDINGLDMIVLNSSKQKFIFTTQKQSGVQKHQFASIVKKFKAEGKEISVLDLRFDKPVVEIAQ